MLGLVNYDSVLELVEDLKKHINDNYVKREDYEALLQEVVELRELAAKLDDMKIIDVDSIKEAVLNGLTGCVDDIRLEEVDEIEEAVEEELENRLPEDPDYYEDQPAYKVTIEPVEEEEAVEEVKEQMYDADNDIYVDL